MIHEEEANQYAVAVFCTFIVVIKDHRSGRRVESYNMAGSSQGDVEAFLVLRDKVIHNPNCDTLEFHVSIVTVRWEIAVCQSCRCFQVVFTSCWKVQNYIIHWVFSTVSEN